MARNDRLTRAFALLRLLARPGGGAIDELATELDVTRRTLYRDLELLEQAGAPIFQDPDAWPRRWHVHPDFLAKGGLRVETEELLALTALARLQRHADGAFAEAIDGLSRKLRTLAPQGVADEASELGAVTAAPPVQRPRDAREAFPRLAGSGAHAPGSSAPGSNVPAGLETRLVRAIRCGEELRLTYRSRTVRGRADRVVRPLGLAIRPAGSYLLAAPVRDEGPDAAPAAKPRKYKLVRIEALEATGRTFEPVDDFDPDELFAHSFGVRGGEPQRVVVRFSPRAAPAVRERTWHPSQRLADQPDGGVLLTMDVAGLVEVKSWVQSWGADALVVKPSTLRDAVVEDARRVAAATPALLDDGAAGPGVADGR